jgi:hypothetical protein
VQTAAASPYVLKNRIINGAMQVWQRGTTSSSTGYVTVDRWTSSNTTSFNQSSDVPTGFKYSLEFGNSSANYPTATQRIESFNCTDLSGANITISFWAKNVSGSAGLYVDLYYANSTDNFSTSTYITGSTISSSFTSTIWTLYTATFTAMPTSVVNGLEIRIYRNNTNASIARITGVQLEIGTSATPFERRLYNQELANCYRYYYRIKAQAANDSFGNGLNDSTTAALGLTTFPVTMRTSPTGLEQSGNSADYKVRTTGSTLTTCNSGPTFNTASPYYAEVIYGVASGLTAGQANIIRATTTNAYLGWSAEL